MIAIPRKIRRGMSGDDVRALRRAMVRGGFRSPNAPGGADTPMLALLEGQVRAAQRKYGLPPSGVVGQPTFNAFLRHGLYRAYELELVENERKAILKATANLVRKYVIETALVSADPRHEPAIHYSQKDPLRWRGIHFGWLPPVYPDYADCSSMFTWLAWQARMRAYGHAGPDIVNGTGWTWGFTGTMMQHGKPVALKDAVPGATACFYSTRADKVPTHVAMFVGTLPGHGPDCIVSHGQENGPRIAHVNYRKDYVGSRVYAL